MYTTHNSFLIQSFPQDNQKVSMGLSGWLYAYEVPSPPLIRISSQSSTSEELGMTSDDEEEEQQCEENSPECHDRGEGEERPSEPENHSPIAVASRISDEQEVVEDELDSDERTDYIAGKRLSMQAAASPPAEESSEPAAVEATEASETPPATKKASLSPSHIPPPSHFSPQMHGFLFAVHRRTVSPNMSVCHHFFSSLAKSGPVFCLNSKDSSSVVQYTDGSSLHKHYSNKSNLPDHMGPTTETSNT